MAECIITIKLSEEDRQRLDVISDTMELIRLALTNAGTPFPAAVATQESTDTQDQVTTTPEPETPAEPQETVKAAPSTDLYDEDNGEITPQPETPTVKMEDVQKKVVALSAAGKKTEVREIVKEYAERVSGIPADKLSEVWDKLTALEG